MTMDADTEKALRESIAHWERLATGTQRPGEWVGMTDCALCQRFWARDGSGSCRGCPVDDETGVGCEATPHGVASAAATRDGLNTPAFRIAAQAELDFLRSLLPEPT